MSPPRRAERKGGTAVAFSLIPDGYYDCVQDVRPEALTGRGITLLLADLDNTLTPYKATAPGEELRAWVKRLTEGGVELFILSNSRRPERGRRIAEQLGVGFIGHAGKPGQKGFAAAMARAGRTPAQTAMVGDQIFTDTLGGSRAGVTTLLVRPIRLAGNPGRYLRYGVETPFRLAARRRGAL